jgi:hypothetical protein
MNFKAVYDALNAQHEAVLEIMGRIDAHFEADETDKALALGEELEAAKAKETEIEELYNSMVESGKKKVTALFVPASQKAEADEEAKTMSLDDYNELSPQDRLEFAKNGKLEEKE